MVSSLWCYFKLAICILAVGISSNTPSVQAKSTLKVAVCYPGIIPYVNIDNVTQTFKGYDVGKCIFFCMK